MNGLNSVTVGGNLVRDASLKATRSGNPILTFTVAVNESRKTQDGWEDVASFVDCTMFGSRAESISKYMSKGTYVCIVGRIHQNRWENQNGEKRSKLEVVVGNIHFESRGENQSEYDDGMYEDDCPF